MNRVSGGVQEDCSQMGIFRDIVRQDRAPPGSPWWSGVAGKRDSRRPPELWREWLENSGYLGEHSYAFGRLESWVFAESQGGS